MAEVISVSALNQYVKTLLDANDLLFDLALRGEIANFVQNARSGHCYFSLRDETSSVKAVMFRSSAAAPPCTSETVRSKSTSTTCSRTASARRSSPLSS